MKYFESHLGKFLNYSKNLKIEDIKKIIEEENLTGLRVSITNDNEKLNDYSIFKDFTFLKGLYWEVADEFSFEFLNSLNNLEILAIQTSFAPINFQSLPNLKKMYLQWNKRHFKTIGRLNKLSYLSIDDFDENNLETIGEFDNLKTLRISTGYCTSLKGIEKYKNLEIISIGAFRRLTDIHDINLCKKLKFIEFDICPKLSDFSSLGNLNNLEIIEIIDCKNLSSIKFISSLKNLQQLSLLGSTIINDKNLIPADNVIRVYYKHIKDYNINLEHKSLPGKRENFFIYLRKEHMYH